LPLQVSATSQAPAAARHSVPALLTTSLGHEVELPSHVSATSHTPDAARHSVPALLTTSLGHDLEPPSQVSATSQTPAAARHWVPAAATPSLGHEPEVPLHVSATSHAPLPLRHKVPAGWKAFAGHAPDVPLQVSATSQVPDAARHTVPAASRVSAGQGSPATPVHFSAATSQAPAFGRQTVVEGAVRSSREPQMPSEHVSSGSQRSPEPARQTVPSFAGSGRQTGGGGLTPQLTVHPVNFSHGPQDASARPTSTREPSSMPVSMPRQAEKRRIGFMASSWEQRRGTPRLLDPIAGSREHPPSDEFRI